jgi:hypothetical protein
MYGWGVLIRGYSFDAVSTCWRCLEVTIPYEDELGLCESCIAQLQDSPRSSR